MEISVRRFYDLYKYSVRKNSNYFLIENLKNIKEAQKYNLNLQLFSVNTLDGFHCISNHDMKKIAGNNFIQEIAICQKIIPQFVLQKPFVFCDYIQDLGNIGTIIRTCVSFGFDNLVFILDDCDLYHHKVFEASRGLFFKLKPYCCSIEQAKQIIQNNKLDIITTDLSGENINTINYKLSKNSAIIFGNETNGITSEYFLTNAQKTITIPVEFESLNVAVAAGIILNKFHN